MDLRDCIKIQKITTERVVADLRMSYGTVLCSVSLLDRTGFLPFVSPAEVEFVEREVLRTQEADRLSV